MPEECMMFKFQFHLSPQSQPQVTDSPIGAGHSFLVSPQRSSAGSETGRVATSIIIFTTRQRRTRDAISVRRRWHWQLPTLLLEARDGPSSRREATVTTSQVELSLFRQPLRWGRRRGGRPRPLGPVRSCTFRFNNLRFGLNRRKRKV